MARYKTEKPADTEAGFPSDDENEQEVTTEAAPEQDEAPKVRIVCTRENAGLTIAGVSFATATIDGEPVHVSALVDPKVADKLCRVPGYAVWPGDEREHARTIEDALLESRRQVILAGQSTQTERAAVAERDELRAANRNLSARLVDANKRLEVLEAENADLRNKNERLQASGVRPE